MQPDSPAPSNNDARVGLPPVKPPSARFIVQLFLIPGLIVAGLFLLRVWSAKARRLAGEAETPLATALTCPQ